MGTEMKITILTENTVNRRGLLAEHGLSVLVEACGRRLLFDVGQSGVYRHNADRLGISLEELDGIILSHGHYDHTGGLPFFPERMHPPVYIRRQAFATKLCQNADGATFREIGIPWEKEEIPMEFRCTEEKEEIFPDIWVLGNIPLSAPEEPRGALFFTRAGGEYLPDDMPDEQLLVIRMPEGLAVFAGCAHVGILNCMGQVERAFPGEHCRFLLAGMHLRGCGRERIRNTIEGLRRYEMETIIPLHCTGTEAIAAMRKAFGRACLPGEAGRSYEI